MVGVIVHEVEWKDAIGLPGYQVSSDGRVRSCWSTNGKQTEQWHDIVQRVNSKTHYPMVTIRCRGKHVSKTVHTMVLEAFVGSRPSGFQACHNNGIRDDNRIQNLRWDSVSGNNMDRHAHGTMAIGELANNARLNGDVVRRMRAMRIDGLSFRRIAEEYQVDTKTAWCAITGKTWSHIT